MFYFEKSENELEKDLEEMDYDDKHGILEIQFELQRRDNNKLKEKLLKIKQEAEYYSFLHDGIDRKSAVDLANKIIGIINEV